RFYSPLDFARGSRVPASAFSSSNCFVQECDAEATVPKIAECPGKSATEAALQNSATLMTTPHRSAKSRRCARCCDASPMFSSAEPRQKLATLLPKVLSQPRARVVRNYCATTRSYALAMPQFDEL